jgi:hypothetical protein
MSRTPPFHSINESREGAPRYHTDDTCDQALRIPEQDLRPGSGGYYQCERCAAMHVQPPAEVDGLPPAP